MSARADIKGHVVAALKTITPRPNVATTFKTFEQAQPDEMPLLQVISGDDELSTLRMQKVTLHLWDVEIWIYTQNAEDLETWIEYVREKLNDDRTVGQHAEDFVLTKIQCTDEKFITTRGVAKLIYKAKFRVQD